MTNQPSSSKNYLVVKHYGFSSAAGNQGRTGTAKTNQDIVFVSKITSEGKALVSKDQIKSGSAKADWFCAVADGHGANGHFVSQYIQLNMPKQYEQEKRRLDRQAKAKELVSNHASVVRTTQDKSSHFESSPNTPRLVENRLGVDTNDKRIRKAMVSTFINLQAKLEQ